MTELQWLSCRRLEGVGLNPGWILAPLFLFLQAHIQSSNMHSLKMPYQALPLYHSLLFVTFSLPPNLTRTSVFFFVKRYRLPLKEFSWTKQLSTAVATAQPQRPCDRQQLAKDVKVWQQDIFTVYTCNIHGILSTQVQDLILMFSPKTDRMKQLSPETLQTAAHTLDQKILEASQNSLQHQTTQTLHNITIRILVRVIQTNANPYLGINMPLLMPDHRHFCDFPFLK